MTGTLPRFICFCSALLLLFSSFTVAQGPTHHAFVWSASAGMRDLGTLPGYTSSEAWAINATGEIAGNSADAIHAHPHAIFWSPAGGLQDLGTLPNGAWSYGYGINSAGKVVGISAIASGQMTLPAHAFLWTKTGGMQDLGTLPGAHNSAALAINDSDQVVGNACITGCSTLTPTYHAFLWSATGGIQDLGTLGGRSSFAVAINNVGQVAGYSNPAGSTFYHAFLWTASGGMKDLGTTSPQISTIGTGINASGNLSVILNKFQAQRAAMWTAAKGYQNIPSLNGSPFNWVANGINDLNHVVGSSWITANGPWHAFLWSKAGGSHDLGESFGGMNSYGTAVNASDEVAGYADIN